MVIGGGSSSAGMVVMIPPGNGTTVSLPADSETVEDPASGMLILMTNSELVSGSGSADAVD
jgi:hypothetical protein